MHWIYALRKSLLDEITKPNLSTLFHQFKKHSFSHLSFYDIEIWFKLPSGGQRSGRGWDYPPVCELGPSSSRCHLFEAVLYTAGPTGMSLPSPYDAVPKHKVIAHAVRHQKRATEHTLAIREVNIHCWITIISGFIGKWRKISKQMKRCQVLWRQLKAEAAKSPGRDETKFKAMRG